MQMLAEKTGFLALKLGIALYLPIILMRFIPFAFIFYGASYIFIFEYARAFRLTESPLLYYMV